MASRRGRKRNDNLPPNRARDVQRAFRARRAAHLQDLESRVVELEEENEQLRVALNMPPSTRPKLGTTQTTRSHRSGEEEFESDAKPEPGSSRHSSGSMSPAVRGIPTMQQQQQQQQPPPGPSGRPSPYMNSPYNLTPTSYTPPTTGSEGGWTDQSGLLMPNAGPHNAPYFQAGKPPQHQHMPQSHTPPGGRHQHNLYLPTYPMTDPNQKPAYHDDHFSPHHNTYAYQQHPPDPSPHPPHSPNAYAHSQQQQQQQPPHRDNFPPPPGQLGPRRAQTDPQRIINHYPSLPPMQLAHPPPAGRHSARSAPAHLLRVQPEEPGATDQPHDPML